MPSTFSGKRSIEIAVFELEDQRFGLPASQVKEVARVVASTPLPRAPAVVEGIVNLRGDLVPVLDLRRRFGLQLKEPALTDHLIFAWNGERIVALRVDRVADIFSVDSAAIERLEPVVPGVVQISGVAKLPGGLVLLHDLPTFLSSEESEELSAAIRAHLERKDG
jgi:purine-binding chemotaxis protein CheW